MSYILIFFVRISSRFSSSICVFLVFIYIWQHNSELGFEFPIKFYIDYSVSNIFKIFFHPCVVEETQNAKNCVKNPISGNLRYSRSCRVYQGVYTHRNFRLCKKKIIFVPNICRIFATNLNKICRNYFFLATNISHFLGANLKNICSKPKIKHFQGSW